MRLPQLLADSINADIKALYEVPCHGCTRCCHGDAIRLLPEDDQRLYRTEPHPYMPGALMLAHTVGGDCVYLGLHGCLIHDYKPLMCREMDCRRIAQAITWTQARKFEANGMMRIGIWQRGKELLRTPIQRID